MVPQGVAPGRLDLWPSGASASEERGPASWWRVPVLFVAATVLARTVNVTGFAVADRVTTSGVDPDGVWAPSTVHHLVQLALTLAVMGAGARAARLRPADVGLTTRSWRWSVSRASAFGAAWVVVQVSFTWVFLRLGAGSTDPGYPLTAGNVVGRLTFSALSGVGEEPMFRGVVMTLFVLGWAPLTRRRRHLAAAAIAGSTAVFMLDHVAVGSLAINPLQEATVLVAGVVYGLMYWRTRSLVGPVIAHGLLNVVVITSGYLFFLAS